MNIPNLSEHRSRRVRPYPHTVQDEVFGDDVPEADEDEAGNGLGPMLGIAVTLIGIVLIAYLMK